MLDQNIIDRITRDAAAEILDNVDDHIAGWKDGRGKQSSRGVDAGLAGGLGLGGDILPLIADTVVQAWSWVDTHKDEVLQAWNWVDAHKGEILTHATIVVLVDLLRSTLHKPKKFTDEEISALIKKIVQEIVKELNRRQK